MVAAVIAVIAGVRAGICMTAGADVDPSGLAGDPCQHARRVGAVGLGRPHHRKAQPVGFLGQRQMVGRRAPRGLVAKAQS